MPQAFILGILSKRVYQQILSSFKLMNSSRCIVIEEKPVKVKMLIISSMYLEHCTIYLWSNLSNRINLVSTRMEK